MFRPTILILLFACTCSSHAQVATSVIPATTNVQAEITVSGESPSAEESVAIEVHNESQVEVPTTKNEIEGHALPITIDAIKQRLAELKSRDDLGDEEKNEAIPKFERSLELLVTEAAAKKKTQQYQREIKDADHKRAKLQQNLESPLQIPELPDPITAKLETLEEAVVSTKLKLDEARKQRDQNQRAWQSSAESKARLHERQTEVAKQLDTISSELETSPPSSNSIVNQAWRVELQARKRMLEAESERASVETARFALLVDMQPLQHDNDQRLVVALEAQAKRLVSIVTNRRNQESKRQAEEARRQARETVPALRNLASRNAELAEIRSQYTTKLGRVTSELVSLTKKLEDQKKNLESVQHKVEQVGLTQLVGMLLRSQREELLAVKPLKERRDETGKELPKVQIEILQRQEERSPMFNLDELTETHFQHVYGAIGKQFREDEVRGMVAELLTARKGILSDLLEDMHKYSDLLGELHVATASSLELTNAHAAYIDERVLWIRSAEPITSNDLVSAREHAMGFFSWPQWQAILSNIGTILHSKPLQSLGFFLLIAFGLSMCDRIKDRIRKIGKRKQVISAYRYRHTIEALLGTVIVSSFWPALAYGSGACLSLFTHGLTAAIGAGLCWMATVWWALSFLRQVARPKGLGESHFGWHRHNLDVLRANLRWLIAFGLPLVFAIMTIRTHRVEAGLESLERISFMVGMITMTLFMHFLLGPYSKSQGIWAKQQVWMYRMRYLLHGIGVAIPLGLAIMTAVGYVYSAFQLAYRGHLTLCLVIAVVVVHALVTRYLLIARRRAALRHMQQQRQAQTEAESDAETAHAEESLDFDVIGDQLQRLLRGLVVVVLLVGASIIWADMVPALSILDRMEISWWQKTVQITENLAGDEGLRDVRTKKVPITVADLMLCLITLFGTIVATRNLPGLMNITIFERLPIDYGARYALGMVTRYLTMLIGIVIAFHMVGVTWGSVQWLVAAMTVGLGFGLQEIFANFVSGLIILTERPVRIGDMVTVGGVMGKVTRMQMRATTITDFDRRELVVPNKKFITEDVINWTLSDPITRVVCPVGISYDSDPELARKVLVQVANENSWVLDEPEPVGVFVAFGDSTLDLELRAFIMGRDHIAQVQDELNLAINRAFKNASLEIAYPQRDLHIRSVSEVAVSAVDISRNQSKNKAA